MQEGNGDAGGATRRSEERSEHKCASVTDSNNCQCNAYHWSTLRGMRLTRCNSLSLARCEYRGLRTMHTDSAAVAVSIAC